MNIQATLEPDTQADDLQLRFVGGKNNGESISISTECCMLGVTRKTADRGSVKDQCAIYRGPAGVAVQSHGSEVLINGEAKSVHWLQIGDQIQLSNSQAVEVVQLGSVQGQREKPAVEVLASEPVSDSQAAQTTDFSAIEGVSLSTEAKPVVDIAGDAFSAATVESVTDSVDVEGDRIDFVSNLQAEESAAEVSHAEVQPEDFSQVDWNSAESELKDEPPIQSESPVHTSAATPTVDADQINEVVTERFETLETSVNQLHDQAANVDRRFDRLEDSLNALTEHIERLAVSSLSRDSVAADSVEPVTDQPALETAAVSDMRAPSPAEPDIESAFEALNTPIEATTQVAVEPEVAAPSENYVESIATLFSDLAKTDEPAEAADVSSSVERAFPVAVELSEHETGSTGNEDSASADSMNILGVEHQTNDSLAQPSAQSVAPDVQVDAVEAGTETAEDSSDPSAVAFTERMMESIESDTPTLSSAELASEIGLGTPEPVEAPEPPTAPVRAEVRTESVAEIFARLQAGAASREDGVEEPIEAPVVRQPVQTTFEDIQASISAALDEEVVPVAPANDVTRVESIDQSPQDDQVAEVEPSEETVVSEAVEPSAPAQPANDVNSVMERLRASIDDEAEEEAEPAVDAKREDSVDDYMSMLLNRMRGDGETSDADQVSVAEEATELASQAEAKQASERPMTEEEFTPRQKAVPIKSLDKMRELANSTSRSAVQQSVRAQQEERKKSLILQSLSLGSLALAAVMFATRAYMFGAAFAVIFGVTFGYVLYEIFRPIGGQDLTKSSVTKSRKKVAVAATEADAE